MIKSLLVVLVIFLTGCATTSPPVTITTKVISPDDSLLLDCTVSTPPDKDAYLEITMKERERLLVGYVNALLKDTSVCNMKMSALRDWKTQTTKAIDDTNKK